MKKEDPQIPLFISYDRSSGKRSRIERIYTDIKIARNTKINHIIVSFVDYYNAIFNYRPPPKLKLEKIQGILIILFHGIPSLPQLKVISKHTRKQSLFSN